MLEPIRWHRLGLCAYEDGLARQEALWNACRLGGPDVCLALEHPPTITLGRRASGADLRVNARVLAARGVTCVATARGGRATYHGPGQLVVYPIVDLRRRGLTVQRFVWLLEEIMIRAAGAFEVVAWRDPRGRGVWARGGKLGAVGIRVREHVSTHGFALNVDTDLRAYGLIVSCGMADVTPTSLVQEGVRAASVAATEEIVARVAPEVLAGTPAEVVPRQASL